MSRVYIAKALRKRIAQQAHQRCGYCQTQERVAGTPMEIDHIVPHALGGPTEEVNLWLACSLCNEHKGDRVAAFDPETAEVVRLFHPRQDLWNQHFVWVDNGEQMIGLTSVGRATMIALQLNRPSLIRSRRLWVSVGWHPPDD